MSEIKKIKEEYFLKLNEVLDQNKLNEIKTELFGKNGILSTKFKKLQKLSGNMDVFETTKTHKFTIVFSNFEKSVFFRQKF